jgi:TRAP-type C4-dicarboxylate transport system substrate-binding protein
MAGAVAVTATLPEAVTLLQRGGLDCQHGVHSWLKTFGYADFAKYVTDYPTGLSGPAIGLMMNRDAWNKMTPAQKTIHLKKAAWISAAEAVGEFTTDNKKHLDDVIKNRGVKMVKADGASFEALFTKYRAIQEKNVIASGKKFGVPDPKKFGVPDPKKIMDTYLANVKKWEGLTKDIGGNIDKFADLIWQEIYSKVDVNTF